MILWEKFKKWSLNIYPFNRIHLKNICYRWNSRQQQITTKNRNYFSFNDYVDKICFILLYLRFTTSNLHSEDMPCHFLKVESLSFPQCPKCNNKVPLRFFQQLPLCRTDFYICSSLNTSSLTSSSQGSVVLFPPHLNFPSLLPYHTPARWRLYKLHRYS